MGMHHFQARRKNGFGENLYRNLEHRKIGGVCAGLADHFDIDRNIMRIAYIAFFIFAAPFAFWGYIILWVLLAPRPKELEESLMYDEEERCYKKKKLFKYTKSVTERMDLVRERLALAEQRVTSIERYVTSNRFKLNEQFSSL